MRTTATLALVLMSTAGCTEEPPLPSAGLEQSEPAPLENITRPAEEGNLHLVRLVQRVDHYAFEPSEITISQGDVLRFVMTGSQPESVAFDHSAADPQIADFIQRNNLHQGVLLTDAGQAYTVSFTDAPPGEYTFLSVPHREQGMRGVVHVRAEAS